MFHLQKKIIVVTGACGLLGKTFVQAILKQQATVIAADINASLLQALKKEIPSAHLEILELDITSKTSIQTAIEILHEKYGKIDALVNNAYPRNKNYGALLEEVSYSDFCENTNLHLGGYFLCMQQFALYFKKQGYGNVISMSSVYGVIPPRFEVYENAHFTMPVEYAAIKSAVVHLSKYFATYYKQKNIRFNCISPGGIFNNQDKDFVKKYNQLSLNKGMLDKEDIEGALLFLLSDASAYINGQNIVVDDGFSL
ncbi:MAG: SDR family oxidoreductase [Bacteroidetes bacterium]|nr:SDR family oxidoreductase [Bacteroidota bacterium]